MVHFLNQMGVVAFGRRRIPKRSTRWGVVWREALTVSVLFCCAGSTLAGGGPEGVLLVVNPLSQTSMTIANHYVEWRAIPADNVLYVPWQPNSTTTDVDSFRQRILLPVLAHLKQGRLTDQIDAVVYSSDFPWGIALDNDIRRFVTEANKTEAARRREKGESAEKDPAVRLEWPKQLTPLGSINGMTFLWQAVGPGFASYFEPRSNHFMLPLTAGQDDVSSRGFRGSREYGPRGEAAFSGRRYYLSTMLGVTSGRGNSLAEVLAYLKRSAAADATHPKGTIYYVKNNGVRSTVRDRWFPAAVAQLGNLGVRAQILEGTMPLNRDNVQGVVMGTPSFDWKASASTILPGAICDNFTSFGGMMNLSKNQTPLSEFLRYGAAGASGTVTEPFAIASKFPSPFVQVHYARGCTLVESFYQSISSPYQLLIVGDPLCCPWADPPEVQAVGVEPGAVVRGPLTIKPSAKTASGRAVQAFELFLDGQRVARCKPGETLDLDTTKAGDGHHELRIVAIGPAPIETQGRRIVPVTFNNHGRTIEASLVGQGPFRFDAPLRLAVRSPGSVGIIAVEGSRIIGRLTGEEGQIEIPGKTLGSGPVQLRVAGLGNGGTPTNVLAKPIRFTVE